MAYGDLFRALPDDAFRAGLEVQANTIIDLLCAKRASYGPDNLTRFGEFGILVRVGDKLERLAHMHRQGLTDTAVGESLDDAWDDILGYALLRKLVAFTEAVNLEDDNDGTLQTSAGEIDSGDAHMGIDGERVRKAVAALRTAVEGDPETPYVGD